MLEAAREAAPEHAPAAGPDHGRRRHGRGPGEWPCLRALAGPVLAGGRREADRTGAGRAVPGRLLPPMGAERVVGTLPNLVANRINTQLDLGGAGYTVSAEEASGPVALRLAARALRAGEADAALVGAVDLSCEPVHRAALDALGRRAVSGDAAVVLVLKRLADARRDGDPVLALLDDEATGDPGAADVVIGDGAGAGFDPAALFGRAHAAHGLLAVATAVTALRHRALPRAGGPAETAAGLRTADVVVTPLEARPLRLRLRAADAGAGCPAPGRAAPAPRLHVYSGARPPRGAGRAGVGRGVPRTGPPGWRSCPTATPRTDRDAVRRWLPAAGQAGRRGVPGRGRWRAGPPSSSPTGRPPTRAWAAGCSWPCPRSATRSRPRTGAPARRPGPRSARRRSARPDLGRCPTRPPSTRSSPGVLLGLRPDAALGYSSGESAALAALGAWPDVAGLHRDTWDERPVHHANSPASSGRYARAWERLRREGRPVVELPGQSAARPGPCGAGRRTRPSI